MEYKNFLCVGCCDKNSPYISKFGTYSPCLKCENGSNYRMNKRLKVNRIAKEENNKNA